MLNEQNNLKAELSFKNISATGAKESKKKYLHEEILNSSNCSNDTKQRLTNGEVVRIVDTTTVAS